MEQEPKPQETQEEEVKEEEQVQEEKAPLLTPEEIEELYKKDPEFWKN